MLIGQQSGPSSDYEKIREIMQYAAQLKKWNKGMATPASYARAVEAVKSADEERRIVDYFFGILQALIQPKQQKKEASLGESAIPYKHWQKLSARRYLLLLIGAVAAAPLL